MTPSRMVFKFTDKQIILLLHVLFPTMFSLYQCQCMVCYTPFKSVSLQGTYLVKYKSQYPNQHSLVKCASWCAENQDSGPNCEAFEYNSASGGSCDFYKMGAVTDSVLVPAPNIRVFLNERSAWRNVFHDFELRGKLFSIYFSSEKKSFSASRRHCNTIGGYLIEFDSLDEYDAVRIVVRDHTEYAFVGANDIRTPNKWVTDSKGLPIDRAIWQWKQGEPSGSSGEACARLSLRALKLFDTPCERSFYFLCERDVTEI